MQPLFEHGLTLGGFSTRVLELEGVGPPLVFFHGFSDSADTWRPTMARLGRADRRAVAVDLPGFGRSTRLVWRKHRWSCVSPRVRSGPGQRKR